MRELKFRVWCKRTQEYHTPIDKEDYDADGENLWLQMCIDTNGRLYFIETSNEDADYEYVTHDCEIIENQDDNFIIEQYTGLKDKNGKEIYVGDIVKVEDDEYTQDTNKFLGYNVAVKASISKGGAFTVKNWWGERILNWDVPLRRVEVIGTIHENPELLEEGK